MLSRVYIDNFRCFVNFDYSPRRRELIMGSNGSGKSSLVDAILFLRQFAIMGEKLEDYVITQRTRWVSLPQQTCEIEASIDGKYTYRVVLEPVGDPARPRVVSESVFLDEKPIFEFKLGEVHLFNDRFEHKVTYPFDWHRSALATITPRPENTKLTRFRQWLENLFCFRINPFAMTARAEGEDLAPRVDLSNFAGWYRHLFQTFRKEDSLFISSLRAAIDGFEFLELVPAGENVRVLLSEFNQKTAASVRFGFNELSEGQRCLICLYAILHFLIEKGCTVILDEPDNFISLREIQPWLNAVSDSIEERKGQVLIISHHPEILNQWAPNSGVQFFREGTGPVRAKPFSGEGEKGLSPAELIARGWEND